MPDKNFIPKTIVCDGCAWMGGCEVQQERPPCAERAMTEVRRLEGNLRIQGMVVKSLSEGNKKMKDHINDINIRNKFKWPG